MSSLALGLVIATGTAAVLLLCALLYRAAIARDQLLTSLAEVKGQLQASVQAQQHFPRLLSEERAIGSQHLSSHFADLSKLVSRHLEFAHHAADERMAAATDTVADVRERLGHLREATDRLEQFGAKVTEVQELLRVPHLRGAVGEVWLEDMLRQVFPPDRYEMQYRFPSGDRVDAVIRVGDHVVAVDAKFPLDACQRMLTEQGDMQPAERSAFIRSVRKRIDEIATKYVLPEEGTLSFALMYIPSERVYYEAVAGGAASDDDTLLAYGMRRHVVPVSPQTLYAYLMTIQHGLRQLRVGENIEFVVAQWSGVARQVEELRRRHRVLEGHLERAAKQHAETSEALRELERVVHRTLEGDLPVASGNGAELFRNWGGTRDGGPGNHGNSGQDDSGRDHDS